METVILNCEITDTVYRSGRSTVLRGLQRGDRRPVAIKVLTDAYPRPRDLAMLRHEFRMARRLRGPGVIEILALEPWGNNLALVEEDFGGAPWAATPKLEIDAFLAVATAVTSVLARVHELAIHGDISPSNILWSARLGEVRLIDFGAASALRSERAESAVDGLSEGALPYMAPERSGRLNREVDHRTDLYSLGATFYEILAGARLFEATDRATWTYSHLTRQPRPPHELRAGIPRVLSDIVLRLLAKNPEDRYQSARGLLADLDECHRRWRANGDVDDFELGGGDMGGELRGPRLYGRDADLQTILAAFGEARAGATRVVMVSGEAGVGKTALVNEARRLMVRAGGKFIEGKFDQFQRRAPYAAVADALRQMVVQMLSEPDELLAARKAALQEKLAPNGQLVLDLVPEMEGVIGPQPAVAASNPVEEQNRFQATVGMLVKTFARGERPLVIFLDDLHWSDAPTLALIDGLLADRTMGALLLIGAYRSSEVPAGHALARLLADVAKGSALTNVDLAPLTVGDVGALAAAALGTPAARTVALAEVLHDRTRGNPLLVRELLGVAGREAALWFDTTERRWFWDLDRIRRIGMGEDGVELLLARLRGLPPDTQRLLQLAACLGATFDLATLALIEGNSLPAVAQGLSEAVGEELVFPIPNDYGLHRSQNPPEPAPSDDDVPDGRFRFQHDRVQQAAYELIPTEERRAAHGRIGRALNRLPPVEREGRLVEIARHMNAGASTSMEDGERLELAQVNLTAAHRARAAAAFAPAFDLLESARVVLPSGAWQSSFDLAYEVHHLGAACAYMLGLLDVAEERVAELLRRTRTPLEIAKVYAMQLTQLTFCDRMDDAVAAGLRGLRILGVRMSARPSMAGIVVELLRAKKALGGRPIAELENAPRVNDPAVRLCMRILVDFIPPAYLTGNDKLFAAAVLKQVRLTLKHGTCPESAAAYASYVVLLAGLGDLASADQFGKLALRLTERFNAVESRCRNLVLYALFGQSWNRPWRDLSAVFQEAVRAGLECGDLLFTAYTCGWVHLWDPDLDVKTAAEEGRKYLDIIEQTDYQNARDAAWLSQQVWANLLGQTRDPMSLSNAEFDEDLCRERMARVRNVSGLGIHALYHIVLCLLYGEEQRGFQIVATSRPLVRALAGSPYMVEYALHAFLICASVADLKPHRRPARREMRRLYAMMRRWAKHAPANFGQHLLLMDAERAALDGKVAIAARLYERAIAAARDGRFARYEALANERAARFCSAHGLDQVASVYAREAQYHYARWGAVRKATMLEAAQRELPRTSVNHLPGLPGSLPAAPVASPPALDGDRAPDVEAVWRASQTFSEEVVLENLVARLLSSVCESAGATRVCLLMREPEGHELLVRAETRDGGATRAVTQKRAEATDLPLTVIRYALRSGQPVILADARREGDGTNDPYLRDRGTLSVLALPIVHRGEPLGVFYLENDVIMNAFDPQRVATLQMLASQAAISLQNARLYEHIQQMADSFSRFVPREFLRSLGRTQVSDIHLGESVEKVMTVLFSDIRGFTTLVERMSPTENISFVNSYIAHMEPVILAEGGFIDSYIGDAIMALFDVPAARAVSAAVAMLGALDRFNQERAATGGQAVQIGIGLNTGPLTLGTIGGAERLKCGVIGDTVNIAARVEGLTKRYGVPLLITGATHRNLPEAMRATARVVDHVCVAGSSEALDLYEVFGADPARLRDGKSAAAARWQEALDLYYARRFADASRAFTSLRGMDCLAGDLPTALFEERSRRLAMDPPGDEWTGVEVFREK